MNVFDQLKVRKSSDVIQAYTYLSKKTHLTLFLCRSSCRKSRRKFCTDSNVMCPQMTICLHATYTHETVHWQRGRLPRTDRASAFLSQNFWPGLRACRTTMWKFSFHTVDRIGRKNGQSFVLCSALTTVVIGVDLSRKYGAHGQSGQAIKLFQITRFYTIRQW